MTAAPEARDPARLGDVIRGLRQRFAAAGLEDAGLDARLLACGLLGLGLTDAVLAQDRPITTAEEARIEAAARRRLAREPVHRILGVRSFYGLDLALSPATLEPRPDTEILVDRLLPYLADRVRDRSSARVLDLGTGTGAIVLALLSACPGTTAVATDLAPEALETARTNARTHGLADRLTLCRSDWFAAVEDRFDLIVSNPPYIPAAVIDSLSPEVRRHDPRLALDGGEDGLRAYRAIATGARNHLTAGGFVGLEIGFDQRAAVTGLFLAAGFDLVEASQDHGGNDRVLVFR